jgi:hypothetical protein
MAGEFGGAEEERAIGRVDSDGFIVWGKDGEEMGGGKDRHIRRGYLFGIHASALDDSTELFPDIGNTVQNNSALRLLRHFGKLSDPMTQ